MMRGCNSLEIELLRRARQKRKEMRREQSQGNDSRRGDASFPGEGDTKKREEEEDVEEYQRGTILWKGGVFPRASGASEGRKLG